MRIRNSPYSNATAETAVYFKEHLLSKTLSFRSFVWSHRSLLIDMAADTLTAFTVAPEIPESMENFSMMGVQENALNDQAILQELGQLLSQKVDASHDMMASDNHPGVFAAAGKRKVSATDFFSPAAKKSCVPKSELLFATEPVTPVPSSKGSDAPEYSNNTAATSLPLSPGSQSMCSEEDDDQRLSLLSPLPTDFMVLPTPSKDQAAKRRAFRLAHRKRSRCKKEEGSVARSAKSSDGSKDSDSISNEPVDKKAARAIRNREAAMKSRVEAKQKMRRLEEDNDQLAHRVRSLSDENKVLTEQLRSLVCHTFGPQIAQGHDIKDILAIVGQLNKTNAL